MKLSLDPNQQENVEYRDHFRRLTPAEIAGDLVDFRIDSSEKIDLASLGAQSLGFDNTIPDLEDLELEEQQKELRRRKSRSVSFIVMTLLDI